MRSADDWYDDEPRPRRRRPAPAGALPLRLAQSAAENPVMAGGLFVALLTAALIVSNALGNQPARHPAPLFETRPFADATPVASRLVPTETLGVQATVSASLVRDVQMALKDRGFYRGAVDGVMGPVTADAIRAFEKATNLPETGLPTESLLQAAYSRRIGAPPPAMPASTPAATPQPIEPPPAPLASAEPEPPARQTVAVALPRPRPATTPATTAAAPSTTATTRAVTTKPIDVRPAAPVAAPAAAKPAAPVGLDQMRVSRVQRALDKLGYGPVQASGKLGSETTSAVKRFQLDRGLTPTGEITDRLMFELIASGAAL
jgi:peptidoglycan hydrolase-like protein with peptidoglycan-binding domain